MDLNVKEAGDWESLVPVWGSGRNSVHHFQQGNWGRGVLYAGLAASDVFLLKSLGQIGGRLIYRSGVLLMNKESSELIVKGTVQGLKRAPGISVNEAAKLSEKALKSQWTNLGEREILKNKFSFGPGVQLTQIDGWFVKRVGLQNNAFKRTWGMLSIEAQEQGLVKLGSDLAPQFFVKDGMLFTRSVGNVMSNRRNTTFFKNYVRGSIRMKTILNDICPRNMGINGIIFDPSLDPLMKAGVRGILYGITMYTHENKWYKK